VHCLPLTSCRIVAHAIGEERAQNHRGYGDQNLCNDVNNLKNNQTIKKTMRKKATTNDIFTYNLWTNQSIHYGGTTL
jgi:hypothetical protein